MAAALEPLTSLLQSLQARLSTVESQLGITPPAAAAGGGGAAAAGGGGGAPAAEVVEDQPFVAAYAEVKAKALQPFLDACQALGGVAADIGAKYAEAFNASLTVTTMASRCKKPSAADRPALMAPVTDAVKAINGMKDRTSPFVNHLNAAAEGAGAFQWCMLETGPGAIVEACLEGAEFWLNKIRMQYRGKDDNQIAFCNTLKGLIAAIVGYIKEHHKLGLSWNPRGSDAKSFGGSAGSASAAPAATKPAPAPPAPRGGAGGGAHMTDVFAQLKKIDQSSGKTAGLRHVTKDMKSKGAPSVVPATGGGPAKPAPAAAAKPLTKGPPRLELVKKRWFVENQVGPDPIELTDTTQDQEVYIYGCHNATIIVKNKIKAMTIDSCKRSKVIFASAVSAVELVNCQRMQTQVTGHVPSIAIDKTDGCVIYLSYESREAQIVTSKCSELNVSFPTSDAADADWTEMPIPEQFVSVLRDGRLETNVSDLYSG